MKEIEKKIKQQVYPPVWDPCHYLNVKLRKTYEEFIAELLNEKNKCSVLDYGCGIKPYKHLFGDGIAEYIGADLESNLNSDVTFSPGEKLPFENDRFDVIISSQVLEHVQDVEHYMNECYRLLKPDGILLLSTHGTWQYHASPYDYYRWTRKGLELLMEKHNFEIIKIKPVLGQLALTSQLRLNFYTSSANNFGGIAKILLLPVSFIYQFKMMLEDLITPERVKERDSAIFVLMTKKSGRI
ncbi:MAG: class I SAM-dependent methyltransferase [Ignavibacteria bacterium]|nr:class I SAM-dependent methyltransferase [Ignavibacteria bacterium]